MIEQHSTSRTDFQNQPHPRRWRPSRFLVASLAVLISLMAVVLWCIQPRHNIHPIARIIAATGFIDPTSPSDSDDTTRGQTRPAASVSNQSSASIDFKPPPPPFDLEQLLVPRDEIKRGGPGKDGIPALTDPKFIAGQDATYLEPNDRVIGIRWEGQARAYPLAILNYHEVVNDLMGSTPIAVTYCPLCDSAAVFDRRTPLGERTFGVSGLLYNSNVLMYDRGAESESLWSQLMATGISADGKDASLKALPVELTRWSDWFERHPDCLVLSTQTGHNRNYDTSPYSGYMSSRRLMFPVNKTDDRLPKKARVLGAWTESASKAYPLSEFSADHHQLEDEVGGIPITLEYRSGPRRLRVVSAGEGIQWLYSFWFAWYAFHPETDIYKAGE